MVEDDHAGHDHKRKRRAIDMSTVLEPGAWVRFFFSHWVTFGLDRLISLL